MKLIINPPIPLIVAAYAPVALVSFADLGWLCAGIGLWSFAEYAIHRWFLHGIIAKHHRAHHIMPSRNISVPLPVSAAVIAIIAASLTQWLSGFVLGYLAYEVAHRIPPRWHLRHHVLPTRFYGVTTTVWDSVFGTK